MSSCLVTEVKRHLLVCQPVLLRVPSKHTGGNALINIPVGVKPQKYTPCKLLYIIENMQFPGLSLQSSGVGTPGSVSGCDSGLPG